MKTTFKAIVLAASLSMIAGSAFAVDTDLATLTDTGAPFATASDATVAVQALVVSGGGLLGADVALVDNVAAIVQFGTMDINYAFIDQAGVNNAAAIVQDSANNGNSAAIVQVGTGNRAFINQR